MRDPAQLSDQLHEQAVEQTGLSDFGDERHRDGLDRLLESYVSEAALTDAGWVKVLGNLQQGLTSRLRTEASWHERPTSTTPMSRPIFVTGLPRSGTTALHRLLCADPRHQGLELWLAAAPQARPGRDRWETNPDFRRMQDHLDQRFAAVPGLKGMHFMSADIVEECWWLERQTMRSIAFPSVAHLPSYTAWLAEQDLTDTYERHRRILHLIGADEPDRRWVLKNPGHLFSLEALFAIYPDALVVQTHRDPRAVIASISSVTAKTSNGHSTTFTGAIVGGDNLDLWGQAVDRSLEARAEQPERAVVDVYYEDFIADPIGTVEGIYRALGSEFDGLARAAVTAADDVSHRGDRKPDHRYGLEEFSLTAAQVDERFASYLAAHPRLTRGR